MIDWRRPVVTLLTGSLLGSFSVALWGCGGEPGDVAGRGSVSIPRAGAAVVDNTKGDPKAKVKAPASRRKLSN
ncbi:MAG: hypothetical protein AB7I30_14175 [Isosphaeraceae bacterium]